MPSTERSVVCASGRCHEVIAHLDDGLFGIDDAEINDRADLPYPATTQQTVSQIRIAQIRPGQTLQAVIDPANPAAIWLDLSSVGVGT